MADARENFIDPKNRLSITRDQLVTIGDLAYFKTSIVEEIRMMLKEHSSKSQAQWIKSKDVRKILSISHGTLQNLRINGILPFIKLGGTILYKYEDIVNRLEKERAKYENGQA
jgi:hypothetical protein